MAARLLWVYDSITDAFKAPFSVALDNDYYSDLQKRYRAFFDGCRDAGADELSLKIIDKYSRKVLEALRKYYSGRVSSAHMIIKNLVKGCLSDGLAISSVTGCQAFSGATDEIQFFRARCGTPQGFAAHDMLHLPYSKRSLTGSYRFSIPGVPSLYLANSSYGCWIELGQPSDHDFNVSPVLVDGDLKILNLAVMDRDFGALIEFEADAVHSWLKLLVLMVATSYHIEGPDRNFKSEYIVSQSIMLACQELGLDGIAYYSKRVGNQVFARAAINLALISKYKHRQEYGDVCKHIKVGDSFNYFMFRQLGGTYGQTDYDLRCLKNPYVNNIGASIGSFERQYSYSLTNFCDFDKFLFAGWKDKDQIEWGNAL